MNVSRHALGAAVNPNPYAGTYSDIACPTSCYLLGNGLDMEILGQECWPCHNVCPSGTAWDTSSLSCSSTPATQAPPNTGCPGWCSWLPFASTLFASDCGPCSGNVGGTNPAWLIGGLVAVTAALVIALKV